MEDGIVKDGAHAIEQGVGVRAISGEKTGFAYSDEIDTRRAARSGEVRARDRARWRGAHRRARWCRAAAARCMRRTIRSTGSATKPRSKRCAQLDRLLRAADPRVKQVMVSLAGGVDTVLVARSDGVLAADVRPLVRFNVQVIVEQNGRREAATPAAAGVIRTPNCSPTASRKRFAREALRQALVNLEAIDAPAGRDAGRARQRLARRAAARSGRPRPGRRLQPQGHLDLRRPHGPARGLAGRAPSSTTARCRAAAVRSTSTTKARRPQCTTLIEDGVLVGYMQDTLNARLMGMAPTGNGRRESFAHLPMPRMTNTYMLAGTHDPEEMIRSVKKGLYAVNFGGGQVDITSGKYVFSATEAYLIEDGKITAPVKGATLIGNGPETMQRVKMIGNDLALDEGVGVCGKDGQSVPVGVGPAVAADRPVDRGRDAGVS